MDNYGDIADGELLERVRGGDRRAYRELFDRYYEDLCRQAAVRLNGDAHAAEDVVQLVFIDFWVQKRYDAVEGNVKNYLARMMHFKVADHVRNEIRKRGNQSKYLESEVGAEVSEAPEGNEALVKALHKAISELPEQCRLVFTAAYLEEKTYNQVAEQFGISKNTVKSQMKTAMAKLRTALKGIVPLILLAASTLITLMQTFKRL